MTKQFPTTLLSVVVPVYRSERTIPDLVERLVLVLDSLVERYEIVLVNDASPDGSWNAMRDAANKHSEVQTIDLVRNCGQHNALLCGIRTARYGVIVTMDDDLQHPPEEIPRLLEKLGEGYDVVYGTPETEQHGLYRNLASHVTKLALSTVVGAETARKVSAFRAFRTSLREAFERYQDPFVCIDVLLTWGTTRFAAVPVRHHPRRVGGSNYSFRKLMAHTLNMMTGFSTVPLQFASLVGFTLTLFGAAVLLYVLARYVLEGGSVPGFPFLASVIAIFSGAQLFALGIIGEYLARMHFRMMGKPSYTVKSTAAAE